MSGGDWRAPCASTSLFISLPPLVQKVALASRGNIPYSRIGANLRHEIYGVLHDLRIPPPNEANSHWHYDISVCSVASWSSSSVSSPVGRSSPFSKNLPVR